MNSHWKTMDKTAVIKCGNSGERVDMDKKDI
jgi:hypothetical protein